MKNKESSFIEQSSALDFYLTTLLSDVADDAEIQPDKETAPEGVTEEQPLTAAGIDLSPPQICFEVLPFSVDNLKLAANMDDLAGIVDMVSELTAVSDQPEWFMGLAECHGQKVGIIDSAMLIIGNNSNVRGGSSKHDYKKILLLKSGAWGVACDDVGTSYQLEPSQVRWRTKKKSRPWLLGTMVGRLCAIVDVNRLVPGEDHVDK